MALKPVVNTWDKEAMLKSSRVVTCGTSISKNPDHQVSSVTDVTGTGYMGLFSIGDLIVPHAPECGMLSFELLQSWKGTWRYLGLVVSDSE